MLEQVLAIPEHLRDALWRVESARIASAESEGLLVCGMGGSAIGGDLAAAVLGERLSRPLQTVRAYGLPSWAGAGWTVLCSSYSGETEETISCFEAAAERGSRTIVASTGGRLVEIARAADVPVIGLPGLIPAPRFGVAYMLVCAAEAAALAGVAPRIAAEIEAAATFLESGAAELRSRAAEIAAELAGRLPVIYGAGLTAPVAERWKTQINENAKLPSFFAELPEADHNDICGWAGVPEIGARVVAVMLEDEGQHPRVRRRFELTASAIEAAGTPTVRVEALGESRSDRLLWTLTLGDLVSLELADARDVDPLPITAIESLKRALGSP
jgi:glucose/mannose-6-phosphate isomerase